jgi:hypothetical protein
VVKPDSSGGRWGREAGGVGEKSYKNLGVALLTQIRRRCTGFFIFFDTRHRVRHFLIGPQRFVFAPPPCKRDRTWQFGWRVASWALVRKEWGEENHE